MKKLILLLMLTLLVATSGEVYAKNDKGRGKGSGSKERSNSNGGRKSEKSKKNSKALDAQKNWGKLKGGLDYSNKDEEKKLKEEIKVKKRITKEIKKSDLGLNSQEIEQLVNDYISGQISIDAVNGMSNKSLMKIEKALSKYKAAVETPEVETPEVETPEVETPEVETPEV